MRRGRSIGEGFAPTFSTKSTNNYTGTDQPKARHFVGGIIFAFASLIFCVYWIAFPLNNAKFTNGYQRFGTPPSPNVWRSARYGWEWWNIWLIGLNLLLPYMLIASMVNNTTPGFAKFHGFLTRIALLLNFWVFIALSVNWLFLCNNGYTPYASMCNDPRWCCVYYATTSESAKWCPNTTPCLPAVGAGELLRTSEFFQAWLFSILFFLWAIAHRAVFRDLKSYGLFREVQSSYDE